MRLKEKVVMITGAARGLGRTFATAMAGEGAKIVALDIADTDETVRMITDAGGTARSVCADVTVEADCDRAAEETVAAFGRIDILVNNAAIIYGIERKPFYEIDPAEWDRVMTVNVKGAWLCTRAVFPYMQRQGKGKVVNLSSETYFTGSHGFVHYVTSKAGVVGLTRSMAVELGPHNITINALAPGFTDSEASRSIADISKYDISRTPMGRLQQPDDLIGALLFLSSDDSDFVTGQTILVDGGRVMH
ncbi:MAG: 3-oxoacyl-ACP reductase family protein [Desulfobacteraceae bacterium]|jgi:NAD(P)-dependent dehydrogenase (short-subunit alcohol dehydrogenase family)